MLPDFEGMALLVKVADLGSLSEVARRLNLPKSTVSKRLAGLEARLGVQLVTRTTRRLSLTDAGRAYYERASRIVSDSELLEGEVIARTGEPHGRVRLAAPVGFGQAVLLSLSAEFLARHPAVSLEMAFLDRRVDLVAERFDMMIQYGEIADTSLVARHLTDYRRLLVASPAYLSGAPPLRTAGDVRDHHCILLNADRDHWTLVTPEGELHLRVRSRLAIGNLLAVHRAALDGQGLAIMPDYVVAGDLAAGRLVEPLPDVGTPPVRASLLYARSPVQSVAVRRLIEFLIDRLGGGRLVPR